MIGMKVCQFIDQENGVWKDELLEQCLLDFEAAKVRKITLYRSQQSDILTWPFNADGEYTVKFGYQFLLAEIHRQQPGPSSSDSLKPLWQAIWQLKVLGKVKILVWRACQNSLPTKMKLVKRQVITDDRCDLCKDQQEDVHHALYLCPKFAELWQEAPLWNHSRLKQCDNFIDLLGCTLVENGDPTLFSMVIWAVWNRRNNICLDQ